MILIWVAKSQVVSIHQQPSSDNFPGQLLITANEVPFDFCHHLTSSGNNFPMGNLTDLFRTQTDPLCGPCLTQRESKGRRRRRKGSWLFVERKRIVTQIAKRTSIAFMLGVAVPLRLRGILLDTTSTGSDVITLSCSSGLLFMVWRSGVGPPNRRTIQHNANFWLLLHVNAMVAAAAWSWLR